jgi:glycogen debranching enzyme
MQRRSLRRPTSFLDRFTGPTGRSGSIGPRRGTIGLPPWDRSAVTVAGLENVLSTEGWPYASYAPVEAGDPGRFHCLFGRDSLITSLQVLPARPDVARATLRELAARQGRVTDPVTCEEPGKIGHEFRDRPPEVFVAAGWTRPGPFRYFGTADATSWFLVLLDATRDDALARELEPAWRAAAAWVAQGLDRGGGLLRHAPGPGYLTQQGWRDALDPRSPRGMGVLRPDGSVPVPPLADADTQAVTVAALRATARLSGEDTWTQQADRMRTRITESYLPDVMLIEAGDRPVPGAGSQLGWLLWADALESSAVDAVAERLTRPDITTPFGLRTLSSAAPTFDPHSYHRGSIWPFDSWLGWGGLRAAGRTGDADRLRDGVLDALDRLGRFPELYAVDTDGSLHPIPISNRVQAWTIGARWAFEHDWDGRVS